MSHFCIFINKKREFLVKTERKGPQRGCGEPPLINQLVMGSLTPSSSESTSGWMGGGNDQKREGEGGHKGKEGRRGGGGLC